MELERPERMEIIKQKWADDRERSRKLNKGKFLVNILGGMEPEEEEREGCLICQL